MFCTNCGKKISGDAEFCTECGKKVSGAKVGAAQEKNKSRYFWLFRIIKWIGYPVLFLFMFVAVASDIYYFRKSQIIFISVLAGILLVVLMVILQKYIKPLRYAVMGLLAVSILVILTLLGMRGYQLLFQKPSSLAITVFKGPVSGASVNVYELNANGGRGDFIAGPLTSDASGNVTFNLLANFPGQLFIESKGGFYKSEATGQQVDMRGADVLTAVLSTGTKTAAVTPFTHMAAALAQSEIQAGVAPDKAVISANEAIAKQYGLKSILSVVPVDATNSNVAQATSDEKQYGLLLGGFAQLAKNLGVRSIDLANALAKDWSDGKLDGKENGNPITITSGPVLGNAGINGLSDATKQFAGSGKNYTSLRESSISLNPVLEKIGLHIITASLPSWVSGKQGSFTVIAKGGSLPLSWSVKSGSLPEGFTLSRDGIISGTYTLSRGVTKKIFPQFTLEVKDQQGQTQTVELAITVVPQAPTIITYNLPTLTVGQSYDEVIAKASGGMPPYNRFLTSNGALPAGMQIEVTKDGSGARLTGSPKAKGNFSFQVCVIDAASTEKCGDVAFAVKEKEKPLTWDGHYGYFTGQDVCSSKYPSPLKQVVDYSVFRVENNVIIFGQTSTPIDASGNAAITKDETSIFGRHVEANFQFYRSNGKNYAKVTGSGSGYFVSSMTGERKESYTCQFDGTVSLLEL